VGPARREAAPSCIYSVESIVCADHLWPLNKSLACTRKPVASSKACRVASFVRAYREIGAVPQIVEDFRRSGVTLKEMGSEWLDSLSSFELDRSSNQRIPTMYSLPTVLLKNGVVVAALAWVARPTSDPNNVQGRNQRRIVEVCVANLPLLGPQNSCHIIRNAKDTFAGVIVSLTDSCSSVSKISLLYLTQHRGP
jgi:hypothetical protein